jgi:hypothetical protein
MPDEYVENTDCTMLSFIIQNQLDQAKADDTLDFSIRVATMILAFSTKQYDMHLAKNICYIGQNSNTWRKAYDSYQKEFLADMKAEILSERKNYPQEEAAVLDILLVKLSAILNYGAMNGAPFVPALNGKVPLLCAKYMVDMMDMVLSMEKPLSLASHFIVL